MIADTAGNNSAPARSQDKGASNASRKILISSSIAPIIPIFHLVASCPDDPIHYILIKA